MAQCLQPAETFGAAANDPNQSGAAEKRRKKDALSVPAASCVRRQRRAEGRLGEAVSRRPAHRVGAGRRLGPETARPIVLVGGPAGPPPARRRQPSHAVLGPLQPGRRIGSLRRRRRLASGRRPSCLPHRSRSQLHRSGTRCNPTDGRCGRSKSGFEMHPGTNHAGPSAPSGPGQGAQGREKEPRDSKPELAPEAAAPPTAGYRAKRGACGASLGGAAARGAHSGRAGLASNSAAQLFLSAGGRRPRF